MANPAYEQVQARKVKARLRMLQHAQRVSGNVSQTCRFFGGVQGVLLHLEETLGEERLGWPSGSVPKAPSNPIPHSSGDRFAYSSHA